MAISSSARTRLRRALVLGLVLVPGAVLTFVTWRLIEQERELEVSRLVERRALLAARLAQRMVSRLERERAAARALRSPGAVSPDTGVLVLVAPLTELGIALPWESRKPAPRDDPGYTRLIVEGERWEFVADRPDRAAAAYATASGLATDPAAQLGARLREARALSRAGRADEALAAYAAVADAPADIRDRDGLPFALYGAEGLLSAEHPDLTAVVHGLERALAATDLGPPALYALADLARRAALHADSPPGQNDSSPTPNSTSPGGGGLAGIGRLRAVETRAAAAIEETERLLALRRDLPAVLSLAGRPGRDPARGPGAPAARSPAGDSGGDAPPPSAWRPYGPEPWLIGVADDGDRTLVLVADARRLLGALAAEGPDELGPLASDVELTTLPEPDAELLGPSFPALFAVLPEAALQGAASSDLGTILLVLVLPLVLSTTALAAFLLWRDVRRQVETARLRAQFVSSVSHELKTPLTSIRMYAQTLLLARHRAEEHRRSYLETIVNESERLTRLIENVLDFSRIESGGRSYRMAPASLESIVHDSAAAMSYPLEQGDFDLRVHVEDGLPQVRCDAEALTQAVVNLLSNAVKFSGEARVVELDLLRRDGEAVIRVRDHGRGIEKRHHDAIFEHFFRAPEAEIEGVPGTGLGLALVAHVAHAHGGRVELESAPGQGSTFTIRLPLDREGAAP